MKIVFPFITTMDYHKVYDGGNKYLDYFSKELVKQGVDVTIVTTLLEDKKIRNKTKNGIKYVFLPPKVIGKRLLKLNSPYNLWFSYNLKRYLL